MVPQSESDTGKSIVLYTKNADARHVGHRGSAGWPQESGTAQSAALRWHQAPMTLTSTNCAAEIVISAKSPRIAKSIRDALAPDVATLPKSGERTIVSLKGSDVIIKIASADVPSLRASISSFLLLAGASVRCLTL